MVALLASMEADLVEKWSQKKTRQSYSITVGFKDHRVFTLMDSLFFYVFPGAATAFSSVAAFEAGPYGEIALGFSLLTLGISSFVHWSRPKISLPDRLLSVAMEDGAERAHMAFQKALQKIQKNEFASLEEELSLQAIVARSDEIMVELSESSEPNSALEQEYRRLVAPVVAFETLEAKKRAEEKQRQDELTASEPTVSEELAATFSRAIEGHFPKEKGTR